MPEHSKTPWTGAIYSDKDGSEAVITDADGGEVLHICDGYDRYQRLPTAEDLAFIIEAVKAHDVPMKEYTWRVEAECWLHRTYVVRVHDPAEARALAIAHAQKHHYDDVEDLQEQEPYVEDLDAPDVWTYEEED